MASYEEIMAVKRLIEKQKPIAVMSVFNRTQAGTGALMKLLYEAGRDVSAGEISRELNVSTARVAALLNRLSDRQLIIRSKSAADHRLVSVKLSEKGKAKARELEAMLLNNIGNLIDEIGLDELKRFIATADRVITVLQPPCEEV